MKVDERATKVARKRQADGILAMAKLFGPRGEHSLEGAGLSGRWLTTLDRKTRAMVRRAKDAQNPPRVRARARRKAQRASRKRNRI